MFNRPTGTDLYTLYNRYKVYALHKMREVNERFEATYLMLAKSIQRRFYWLQITDKEAETIERNVVQTLSTTILMGGDIAVIRPEGAGASRMTTLDVGNLIQRIRESKTDA